MRRWVGTRGLLSTNRKVSRGQVESTPKLTPFPFITVVSEKEKAGPHHRQQEVLWSSPRWGWAIRWRAGRWNRQLKVKVRRGKEESCLFWRFSFCSCFEKKTQYQ